MPMSKLDPNYKPYLCIACQKDVQHTYSSTLCESCHIRYTLRDALRTAINENVPPIEIQQIVDEEIALLAESLGEATPWNQ